MADIAIVENENPALGRAQIDEQPFPVRRGGYVHQRPRAQDVFPEALIRLYGLQGIAGRSLLEIDGWSCRCSMGPHVMLPKDGLAFA
jgi:hypothetical protein